MGLKRISAIIAIFLAIIILIASYLFFVKVPITPYPAPPISQVEAPQADVASVIHAPLGIRLDRLRLQLEDDVPRRLWSINRRLDSCVPRSKVSLLEDANISLPEIPCTIVGQANRGAISLGGNGGNLLVRFPVNAVIRAEDVAGIIDRETANGSAIVELKVAITLGRDWQARAKVDLAYRWVEEPGIDFLGQRVRFTDQADGELRDLARQIEQSLERQIGAIDFRSKIAQLWVGAFASVALNNENPPVWLRLQPLQLGIGQFSVVDDMIMADLMIMADTRAVIGNRPDPPAAGQLGPNVAMIGDRGFTAAIPILAEYDQLEPVVLKALRKLASDGLKIEGVGRIDASFDDIEIFATHGGQIAIGISATVKLPGGAIVGLGDVTRGKIWLTGRVLTQADSQILRVEDLKIFGEMDSTTGDLLVRMISSRQVTGAIEGALVEDFTQDYAEITARIRGGASSIDLDGARLNLTIETIEHGQVIAAGRGLHMDVVLRGSAAAFID